MTESPRRNILEMKRSLLIGLLPAEPLPFFGTWAQGAGRKSVRPKGHPAHWTPTAMRGTLDSPHIALLYPTSASLDPH